MSLVAADRATNRAQFGTASSCVSAQVTTKRGGLCSACTASCSNRAGSCTSVLRSLRRRRPEHCIDHDQCLCKVVDNRADGPDLGFRKQQVLSSNLSVGSTHSRVKSSTAVGDSLILGWPDPYADPRGYSSVGLSADCGPSIASICAAAARPSAGNRLFAARPSRQAPGRRFRGRC